MDDSMYLITEYRGEAAREFCTDSRPFGLGISKSDPKLPSVESVQMYGTKCSSGGGDFCQAKVFDKCGVQVGTVIIPGY